MRKHKFKGRELLEILKRMQIKTATAGEKLVFDGENLEGFYIIIDGQCSRHMSLASQVGKCVKQKIMRSATRVALDDEYPKYLNRKIERLDSMDFSVNAMLENIGEAIK